MNENTLLTLLKKELIIFLDELIALLPEEKDFLVIRFVVKDQLAITDIMNYIINQLVPLEHYVKNRDERFFLEHQVFFEELQQDQHAKVNYFKNVWKKSTDEDNKNIIWNWFEHFIQLGKCYQKACLQKN
jgi:predicted KAP-like P-loop ATPase